MIKMPKINDRQAKELLVALSTLCDDTPCSRIKCSECALDGFSENTPEHPEGVLKLFEALHNVTTMKE